MLEHFYQLLTSNLQNQFLSGGIVLMVLGTIAAYARRLPSRLYSWLQRRFIINAGHYERRSGVLLAGWVACRCSPTRDVRETCR